MKIYTCVLLAFYSLSIVTEINAQAVTKTFLDNNGKVTDSASAFYYRIQAEAPDLYKIYYKWGNKLYFEGRIKTIDPVNENGNIYAGDCNWYYRNEKKKAERHFSDTGKESGTSHYYYESGKLWKSLEYNDGLLKDNSYYEYDENGNTTEIFEEEFENNNADWDLYAYQNSKASISNGRFFLESFSKSGTSRCLNRPIHSSTYIIETTFDAKNLKGSKYGLIWGFKDWDNYNYLTVSSNYVSIGTFFEGVKLEHFSNIYCSAIHGSGENNFKLLNDNENLIVSVNGELINKASEMRLSGSNIGFVVGNACKLGVEKLIIKQYIGSGSSFRAGTDSDLNIKGSGTGLILTTSGYIATNSHVAENASYIYADISQNGVIKTYEAKLVVKDEANDLCIIKIEPAEGFPADIRYAFTPSAVIAPGSPVFTLGYPLALSGMGTELKFTDGKISSRTGYNNSVNSFQTTIPVQPGNSGSPVFNDKGELIGLINAKVMPADNVSYAIKLSYLRNLIEIIPDCSEPEIRLPEGLTQTEKIQLLSDYVVLIKIK